MIKFRTYLFFQSVSIYALTIFSSGCKSQRITHLDFLDDASQTYNIMDTLKRTPFQTMALYYLINQSKLKNINYESVEKFIESDSVIQKRIHEKYYSLSVLFLKESKNTDNLLKFKSYKMLTLCNDDMVVEYLWDEGHPVDTFYYENGQIKGFEKIKLYDLMDSAK